MFYVDHCGLLISLFRFKEHCNTSNHKGITKISKEREKITMKKARTK